MTKTIKFTNGHQMPIVGLGMGTWQTTDEKQLEATLDAALEAGYRHFDTAYLYCNDAVIGKVLQKWLQSGKVRREELFIVTKLPLTGMSPEKAPMFLHKSLENLQLDYVDLFLLHAPFGLQFLDEDTLFPKKDGKVLYDYGTDLVAIWKALEKEVDGGRVRSLGVSNFSAEQEGRVSRAAKHKPANNQVELHAYLQQKRLREEMARLGVTVTAFAPIGSPGRKTLYESVGIKWESNGLLNDPIVERIAKAKGKTPVQILLRFLTQQGVVVIPKSVSAERIQQNIQVGINPMKNPDAFLSPEEMRTLEGLDKGEKGRTFLFDHLAGCENHPEYPFKKN